MNIKKILYKQVLFFLLIPGALYGQEPTCLSALDGISKSFWIEKVISFKKLKTLKQLGISVHNDNWIRLQFPEPPPIRDNYAHIYVKNITLGIQFFAQEVVKGSLMDYPSFINVISMQNKLSILGSNSSEPYGGYIDNSGWKDEVEGFVRMGKNLGEEVDREELIALFLDDFKNNSGTLRTSQIGLHIHGFFNLLAEKRKILKDQLELQAVIKIPGLPAEAWPSNDYSEDYWNHIYPEPRYLSFYLKAMHAKMSKILLCEPCSRMEVLALLSDYYYLGINAHLFDRVNHSLLMSQLNYFFLQMKIVRGLSHASLPPLKLRMDAAALTMSPGNFKHFFINEIREQQHSTEW